MNREDCKHHFEVLELPIDADLPEVRQAYLLLKEIYSTESIVTMSVSDEITPEEKEEILREIEEAYHSITELFNEERNAVVNFIDEIVADITVFDGPTLKDIREKLKMSLDDVAMATRVQLSHLVNIEEENFSELPVPVYTRGFVMNYAKYLSIDPEMVATSYMEKYRQWQQEQ
jgi:flagellar biosynthesis protein FlhG